MEFSSTKKGHFFIIRVSGTLTEIRDDSVFKKFLLAVIDEGNQHIAVNFENAEYLSSEMINSILCAYHSVFKTGGELVLIGNNSKIMEILQIVGIHLLLTIYEDEKSFEDVKLKS